MQIMYYTGTEHCGYVNEKNAFPQLWSAELVQV